MFAHYNYVSFLFIYKHMFCMRSAPLLVLFKPNDEMFVYIDNQWRQSRLAAAFKHLFPGKVLKTSKLCCCLLFGDTDIESLRSLGHYWLCGAIISNHVLTSKKTDGQKRANSSSSSQAYGTFAIPTMVTLS
jgi:hypothetical protein